MLKEIIKACCKYGENNESKIIKEMQISKKKENQTPNKITTILYRRLNARRF